MARALPRARSKAPTSSWSMGARTAFLAILHAANAARPSPPRAPRATGPHGLSMTTGVVVTPASMGGSPRRTTRAVHAMPRARRVPMPAAAQRATQDSFTRKIGSVSPHAGCMHISLTAANAAVERRVATKAAVVSASPAMHHATLALELPTPAHRAIPPTMPTTTSTMALASLDARHIPSSRALTARHATAHAQLAQVRRRAIVSRAQLKARRMRVAHAASAAAQPMSIQMLHRRASRATSHVARVTGQAPRTAQAVMQTSRLSFTWARARTRAHRLRF
mmetsp:Transcript_51481/g.102475  ORF Transcript_51481/g.102475 Transcript_51481/m.102475 type:complete len:280 (-) Transcript_51481:744-1583(-)